MSQGVDASQGKAGFSQSRLFRWGIVFWIVAWIGSVCFFESFDLAFKGCRKVMVGAHSGSVNFTVFDSIATSTSLAKPRNYFIFSENILSSIRQQPTGVWGRLSNAGWRVSPGMTYVAFPTSGFLWLWLALGWASEIQRRRRCKIKVGGQFVCGPHSDRSLMILSILLVALAITTTYLAIWVREIEDKERCRLQIRDIQQVIETWARVKKQGSGEPIPWSGDPFFVIPGSFRCHKGGEYILSPLIPANGQHVAKCPHPEHQEYILKKGIERW